MNIGLKYYKEYYTQVDLRSERNEKPNDSVPEDETEKWKLFIKNNKREIEAMNDQLLNASLDHIKGKTAINKSGIHNHEIELKTTYPGLLAGAGYLHEFSIDEALMLGFSFDHTSGLPYIPASSIKGVLRFASKVNGGEYLKSLVKVIAPNLKGFNPSQFVKEVFNGEVGKQRESIYNRDIFFDALPSNSFNKGKTFLGEDYITPHLHRDDRSMDGLKNPVPLKFLKILPKVVFEFNFLLSGEKAGLSASERKTLFKEILLDLGIGAKTNVGYGQFVYQRTSKIYDKPTLIFEHEETVVVKIKSIDKNHKKGSVRFQVIKDGELLEAEDKKISKISSIIDINDPEIMTKTYYVTVSQPYFKGTGVVKLNKDFKLITQ